jgi:hypothetical protein
MLGKHFCPRRIASFAIVSILPLATLTIYLVNAIIRATLSDTNISEFVRKLLPAGNCLFEPSTVFECQSVSDILRYKTDGRGMTIQL